MHPFGQVPLKRHALGSVETFEITADQLDRVEREGGALGFDAQVALFFVSQAISFLIVILTTTLPEKTWTIFLCVCVFSFVMTGIFGFRWKGNKSSFAATIQRIREMTR